jgi:hypothetical protein
MDFLFWGLTIGVIGKIMVAVGILKVHHIMAEEKKIDDKVIHSFALEKTLTLVGIVLILAGYLLELYFYGMSPFLTCHGEGCLNASLFFSQ